MYKVAIVGCGKIAGLSRVDKQKTHAECYKNESRTRLVACIDKDQGKAQKFANTYNCNSFHEITAAFSHSPIDIISICTPDPTHFQITKQILLNKSTPKLIFLEKPICKDKIEILELIELAQKRGINIIINHSRRFSTKYKDLKEIIRQKRYGSLKRINCTYYNGWYHNGTHSVDTILYLTDDKIEWSNVISNDRLINCDDRNIDIYGSLKKTQAKLFISSTSDLQYQIFDFEFWFQQCRLRIENFEERIFFDSCVKNNDNEYILKEDVPELKLSQENEMSVAIELICDYLDTGNGEIIKDVNIEAMVDTIDALSVGFHMKKNESLLKP